MEKRIIYRKSTIKNPELFELVKKQKVNTVITIPKEEWDASYSNPSKIIRDWTNAAPSNPMHGRIYRITVGENVYHITRIQ